MGRPPIGNTPKDKGYRLRMTESEMKKLNYCCDVFGLSKAEIIRQGIDEMYSKALKEKK